MRKTFDIKSSSTRSLSMAEDADADDEERDFFMSSSEWSAGTQTHNNDSEAWSFQSMGRALMRASLGAAVKNTSVQRVLLFFFATTTQQLPL